MDWTDCPIIEQIPGKMSGAPVIRHTPVRAVDLLANRAAGVDELAYVYSLPSETVRTVLSYYDEHTKHLAPVV